MKIVEKYEGYVDEITENGVLVSVPIHDAWELYKLEDFSPEDMGNVQEGSYVYIITIDWGEWVSGIIRLNNDRYTQEELDRAKALADKYLTIFNESESKKCLKTLHLWNEKY